MFYGAFKLGSIQNPLETELTCNFAMLTSHYLVVIEPANFSVIWKVQTSDLMLPTAGSPNPSLDMNCLRLRMCDDEEKILEFPDEANAKTAQSLFEDMFFMLTDQDTSKSSQMYN